VNAQWKNRIHPSVPTGLRYCGPKLRVGRPQGSITGRNNGFSLADALFATCFMMVSCLAYLPRLNMEATFLSETSDDFQQTTRRYNPEHITLRNYRCENLKS
jgi:hypothetical protein